MKRLPCTGTAALLERLSPPIPDELINSLFAGQPGRGRRAALSPAQLFRVNLLALLTPVHSLNLLTDLLCENRAWRSFARLRNRWSGPGARMLHEFRARLDLPKLRQVNQQLLAPLIEGTSNFAKTVALIDSTDLPAATNGYKRTPWANTSLAEPTLVRAAARMVRVVTMSDTKKHTLRLWLRQHRSGILLTPLISWAAPANRDDSVFLKPSIHYCAQHLQSKPPNFTAFRFHISEHPPSGLVVFVALTQR
jgi:hypothetical protein